jgi:hypothetical protein
MPNIKHYITKSTLILQESAIGSVLVNHLHTSSHLSDTTPVSLIHFCPYAWPASSPDLMPLHHWWWGQIKDTAYWHKSQWKEEPLEQIMESTDCIRENSEIIRKTINYETKNSPAFRKTEIILNSNQRKLLNSDIQWYCPIKTDALLPSVTQQLSLKQITQ